MHRSKTPAFKVAIGMIYGLCAIASTHFGVDFSDAILNVRDLAPLCAGLFFDPVSGIIAGLIGGIERYIAGTWFGVGTYTRIACTFATCLSGFWAALLHDHYFHKQIPQPFDAFFMGAAMEVFHMYAIFFTADGGTTKVLKVVNTCSGPMMFFTGLGLALASVAVTIASGDGKALVTRRKKSRIPLSENFQFWLTFFLIGLFFFTYFLALGLLSGKAQEETRIDIITAAEDIRDGYERIIRTGTDPSRLRIHVAGEKGGFDIFGEDRVCVTGTHIGEKVPGKELSDLRTHNYNENFVTDYFRVESVCRTNVMSDGNILVVFIPMSEVYEHRDIQAYQTMFSNILILTLVLVMTSILARRIIGSKLDSINSSLNVITGGNLDEKVSVYSSLEFAELSDDVNQMVDALKGYIDAAEKRVEQELISARTIQEAALPQNFDFPRSDFSLYATMTPAKAVGGDFYDFFFVSRDTLALVIADVSGKGIPASLFMMRSKTAIRTTAEKGGSPAEILTAANLTLCEGNSTRMFVSVWLGLIDLKTGIMRCANAGHEYPCLKQDDGDFVLFNDRHSPVLAIFKKLKPIEYELKFSPGDRIFVYTDGIPEAIDDQTKAYGNDRLLAVLNDTKDLPLTEALPRITEDIRSFAAGMEQFDDITMLGFEYLGPGQSEDITTQHPSS